MRITFVVAALDFGGGMRVIAQYAEGLKRRGHDVLVVSPPPYPYGRFAKFRNAYIPRMNVLSASHLSHTDVPVKILERYRPVLATDVPKADVIIATWWETVEWIASFPDDRGAKIHFIQDYEIWNGHTERVDACLRLPMKKITISRWLSNILVNEVGTSEPTIISNGIDLALFSRVAREAPRPATFGFVYAPNSRKGSDIAIAAISKARANIPNLQFVAFGHNEPARHMSLPDFVDYRISPEQFELSTIYGQCSAWLFPSRVEGFGLPILEAMACGTPVIATPAGAASEILAHGGGVLLDSINSEEMFKEIVRFSDLNEKAWKTISDKARKVASLYSLDQAIDEFEKSIEITSSLTDSEEH